MTVYQLAQPASRHNVVCDDLSNVACIEKTLEALSGLEIKVL